MPILRTYKAFYNGKTHEFIAETSYQAQQHAIKYFKVPKSKQGLLAIVLADVPIDTATLGW
jgi:hypothetical protein